MTESLGTESLGAAIFYVRNYSGSPIVGAKIYTSTNRITWYYRGYTSNVGMLSVTGLPTGTNYYMVSATGYNTVSGSMNITDGVTINVYMTKSLSSMSIGSMTVTSEPVGAHIYIDDAMQRSLTPATIIDIPEGDHVLVLTKDRYNDYITPVTITGGQIITVGGQTTVITANLVPI